MDEDKKRRLQELAERQYRQEQKGKTEERPDAGTASGFNQPDDEDDYLEENLGENEIEPGVLEWDDPHHTEPEPVYTGHGMSVWKLVSGIITIILSVLILVQSCSVTLVGALASETMAESGMAGLIACIFMLAGGIVSIAVRNRTGLASDNAVMILFSISAFLDFVGASAVYTTLIFYGTWCTVCAVLAVISMLRKRCCAKEKPIWTVIMIILCMFLIFAGVVSLITNYGDSEEQVKQEEQQRENELKDEIQGMFDYDFDYTPPETEEPAEPEEITPDIDLTDEQVMSHLSLVKNSVKPENLKVITEEGYVTDAQRLTIQVRNDNSVPCAFSVEFGEMLTYSDSNNDVIQHVLDDDLSADFYAGAGETKDVSVYTLTDMSEYYPEGTLEFTGTAEITNASTLKNYMDAMAPGQSYGQIVPLDNIEDVSVSSGNDGSVNIAVSVKNDSSDDWNACYGYCEVYYDDMLVYSMYETFMESSSAAVGDTAHVLANIPKNDWTDTVYESEDAYNRQDKNESFSMDDPAGHVSVNVISLFYSPAQSGTVSGTYA